MELKPKTRVELHVRVLFGREAMRQLLMSDDAKPEVPSAMLLAFARLHKRALGAATGMAMGGGLMLFTLILVLKGGIEVGPRLGLLGQFFLGYDVTLAGAFVGLAWGFVAGFALGWFFALLHNFLVWAWLALIRSKAEMEQYGDFLDHM